MSENQAKLNNLFNKSYHDIRYRHFHNEISTLMIYCFSYKHQHKRFFNDSTNKNILAKYFSKICNMF